MSRDRSEPASIAAMPAVPEADAALATLRASLDSLDGELHALLMRRAEIVAAVGASAAKGPIKLRPGREASILRARLAAHRPGLPPQAVVRIWRELFAGTTAMQGAFAIAACETPAAPGMLACAREQFGALTPLRACASPAQALAELDSGAATAAVLPLPVEGEPAGAAWWTALMHDRARQEAWARDAAGSRGRLSIVARLPFWAARPEGAPRAQAYVVAAIPPDPSGEDVSLLGLELPAEMSRARLAGLLAAAGLEAGAVLLRRDPGATSALVGIAGFLDAGDPRLARLAASTPRPPVLLGAYAVPVGGPPNGQEAS